MQCEFTNESRPYREKIQIVCNHIAVENQTYFLFRPGSIQSAVGHISERLSCTFTNAGDILFAVCISDLIFRPENTVSTYACNRTHCSVFRHGMVVPEGTKKIGQNVFYNCSNLKEIHFNQGLVEIGGWAFSVQNRALTKKLYIAE